MYAISIYLEVLLAESVLCTSNWVLHMVVVVVVVVVVVAGVALGHTLSDDFE